MLVTHDPFCASVQYCNARSPFFHHLCPRFFQPSMVSVTHPVAFENIHLPFVQNRIKRPLTAWPNVSQQGSAACTRPPWGCRRGLLANSPARWRAGCVWGARCRAQCDPGTEGTVAMTVRSPWGSSGNGIGANGVTGRGRTPLPWSSPAGKSGSGIHVDLLGLTLLTNKRNTVKCSSIHN